MNDLQNNYLGKIDENSYSISDKQEKRETCSFRVSNKTLEILGEICNSQSEALARLIGYAIEIKQNPNSREENEKIFLERNHQELMEIKKKIDFFKSENLENIQEMENEYKEILLIIANKTKIRLERLKNSLKKQ